MRKIDSNELVGNYIKAKRVKTIRDSGKSLNTYIDELFGLTPKKNEIKNSEKNRNANEFELHTEKVDLKKSNEKIETISLMKEIQNIEKELNKLLINEEVDKAREVYNKLKRKYEYFPEEDNELKSQIFSDLLSFNLRIHQLLSYKNKVIKIKRERETYVKNQREKEIKDQKQIIKENIFERVYNDSYTEHRKKEDKKIEKEDKNTKELLERQKKSQIEEDKKNIKNSEKKKEVNMRFRNEKNKKILNQTSVETFNKLNSSSTKREESKVKKERKYVTFSQKNKERKDLEKRKKRLINRIYIEGLKNMNLKKKEEAKKYFSKILEIQPDHKPAIIRLEELYNISN